MLIDPARARLLVVDVQEKLIPSMHDFAPVEHNIGLLARLAGELSLPRLITEQYRKGLGPTIASLSALMPDVPVMEKIAFSCLGDPAIREKLTEDFEAQIVVTGIETHVCVLQTVLELRAAGLSTFVVADAVTSRAPHNRALALERMAAAGAHIVSTEMVLFELLRTAAHPSFRLMSRLIR
ncbi:hydrolase [Pseudoxanthobacter sp.]|uniref:hydrolase n=1 Tax=Pseudoxanthobacter sp. TaxID=1925742 RepID=UPI002FE03DA7